MSFWENRTKLPIWIFSKNLRDVFKKDHLGQEIAEIAMPAALGLLADPIASLIDTAFVGHIGAMVLAAVGVAIAVFNQAPRIAVFPVVSIKTSFVAEENSIDRLNNGASENRKPENSCSGDIELEAFLPQTESEGKSLSAGGSHAQVVNLCIQKRNISSASSALVIVVGDIVNIILDPIFIFIFRMGVSGAAIAHIVSQYIISMTLMWKLMQRVNLLPPHIEDLQLIRFLKNGSLLLLRVIAVTFCVTLGASLAARLGPIPMAAFQICLQVWLATSLLADGLAVAGQAILAGAFASGDYEKATAAASRVLQLGLALGIFLSFFLAVVLQFASKLFTEDANVLQFISLRIPFVAMTQPINSLAFVFDGINYGASDFAYAAYSMVAVAVLSIVCLLLLSSCYGFVGIWVALSEYMGVRALAGFWRIATGTGRWNFLRG